MSKQTKESRKMKELIRIGVFSALWIVAAFLIAFTIGFLPPVLLVLPCILGVLGGIIYTVMLSKLSIRGGIFIPTLLLGLCLFTMAPYGMMFYCTAIGGMIGEILYGIAGKGTKKAAMAGTSCAILGLALGEYIPFIWMQDAYHVLMEGEDPGMMEIAQWCMDNVSVFVMIILCVLAVVFTCLGVLWGNKIAKKRLANEQ